MSDIGNEIQHERKTPPELRKKENMALGKGSADVIAQDQIRLIPDKTPGKEIVIRPRSPFRDIHVDSKKSSSTRSAFNTHNYYNPEDSVRIEDNQSTVRSCRDIDKNSSRSPSIFAGGANNAPHQSPPMMYPTPPPGYTYQPQLYPVGPPIVPTEPEIPDYDNMSRSEQQEARIIFRSKFNSLTENYPDMKFDDYSFDLPLHLTHKIYNQHLKNISVEENSSYTRTILVLIFLGIEAFGTKVLGINLAGYAKAQIASMKRYDRLLLELGEKYTGGGGNWPIEARLFTLAIFNALLIAGVKFMGDKMGTNSDWMIEAANGLVGGKIDSFVETKPEPTLDPVTKTAEVPRDNTRDLMGGVQNLMNMAGSAFGADTKGSKDMASTLGNIGASMLNSNTKPKDNVAKPASKRGVSFGNRDPK